MLKIRLKRLGAKKAPTYRVIVINSTTKREGKPIEELGYYNPKTKEMKLNKESALAWISKGAQPTDTVKYLITNCNEDGTLNYKKSEVVKLSKKAQAKKAEEEARKAEEAAKAEPVAETKEEDAGSAPAGQIVDIVKTETGESVMNDSELVAVITAAVAAASAGQNAYTTYPSKDKLVTRPIRRIKR